MKKRLSSIVFLFFALGLVVGIAPTATATSSTITVQGRVTDYYNGKPEKDVKVKLYCRGADNYITTSEPTDADGRYSMTVNSSVCPIGEKIMATVDTATKVGATVKNTEAGITEINISLIKQTPIPEFGHLGGIATVLGVALVVIIYVRRRLLTGLNY